MVAVCLPVPDGASSTSHFELNIPLKTIQSLCFAPVKWLRFVGWTIFLTPNGYLSHDSQGADRLPDEYVLQDENILYYQAVGNPDDHRPNPPNLRYTLQRFAVKDPLEAQFLDYALARNNQDARFQNFSPSRLPNPALLHYVYGASIMITYGTPETVKAWRCLHGWDRPAIQASLSTGRDHDRTEEKRHEASACGVQDSGDPTVEEEAMDFIMNVGLMQMASREREKWERRKSEIGRWAESLPTGVPEEKTIM
ncbi:hypothetical protein EYR38_007936 [Pleurotus pulmonarius]|nr:hypothetical protein EYR38_007936 [Pleurotus pulmonarius]